MSSFSRFIGRSFGTLKREPYQWFFYFNDGMTLTVECLWRLIESGKIRRTSNDHGQQFGLPQPVDVVAEVNACLHKAIISGAKVEPKLLDLELQFSTGHTLQILPDSSGYEAWSVTDQDHRWIVLGGGELHEITG